MTNLGMRRTRLRGRCIPLLRRGALLMTGRISQLWRRRTAALVTATGRVTHLRRPPLKGGPIPQARQRLRLQAAVRMLLTLARMLVPAVLLRQPLPPLRQQHGLALLLTSRLQHRRLREAVLRRVLPMWCQGRQQAPAAAPPKLRCLKRVTPVSLRLLLAVAALLADRARPRVSRPLIRVLLSVPHTTDEAGWPLLA